MYLAYIYIYIYSNFIYRIRLLFGVHKRKMNITVRKGMCMTATERELVLLERRNN